MRPLLAVSFLVPVALLAGCATVPQPPAYVSTPFDPAAYAWFSAEGDNTITGNAVLRTVGGDVRTCAASSVGLVPGGAYTRERMMLVYGNVERGYRSISAPGVQFANDSPAYLAMLRQAPCDAQGNFTFTGLPDGEYFVLSRVVWGVPMQYHTEMQGGTLMQRVEVRGGETKRIVLSY